MDWTSYCHSEPDGNTGVKTLFLIEILRAKALRMTIFCREGVRCGALNDIPDRIQKSYLRTIARAERKRVPKITFLYSLE